MPSAIRRITLNEATFHNVSFEPTFINFFYGNNGTGKTTIASAIAANSCVTWQEGKTAADYNVLAYNQAFVAANLHDYGDLKGVFTVGERNIQIQNEIAEKTAQRAEQERQNAENLTSRENVESDRNRLLAGFQDLCWTKGKTFRDEFDATITGFKTKAKFAEKLLAITTSTEYDIGELRTLYETAFDPNARSYEKFQLLGRVTRLQGSRGNELLAKVITSSGDTPFAEFMKALNATDWVRQGHDHFTDTAGKCPYCQQDLPDGFENQLATCFDGQYQADIDALRAFYDAYKSDMEGFLEVLRTNLNTVFPKLITKEYEDKLALFEKLIDSNLQIIAAKIKEPSASVSLDNDAVRTVREELNAIITEFNKQIETNNDIVGAKRKNQGECTKRVWELLAHTLQNDIAAYRAKRKKLDDAMSALTKQITDGKGISRSLEQRIVELNKSITSTLPTIKLINDRLRDSGFQGFYLREKRGHQNAYEVIRQDGTVVERLSEGERNFIAFLYFYYLVRGAHSDADIGKDRIVIIDDPVSSMDSNVLFIVGTLVREMVEVCHNNADYTDNQAEGDYIKQIFVLTHNVYFHREITYNQTHRYRCVSFYTITKASNNSTIRHCIRQCQQIPTEMENFNPVQNSYAALWSEYREVDTAIPILNVIRRILEYYFMQLCGYNGVDIRKQVLEENRDSFIDPVENGQPDYTKYQLATAMLSYINTSSAGFSDGLNLIDDCVDIELHRKVFKLIFVALHQEQHYYMMMGEKTE